MFRIKFLALLTAAASLMLPAVAHAQPGLSTKPNYDGIYNADRIDEATQRDLAALHTEVTDALAAQDFATAEAKAGQLVRRNPTTLDAQFLMGLAKIGLGQWDEARSYLQTAIQKEPKRPEPKTRLGLAYARLNDLDAAKRQRADLATLDASCKNTCSDAVWIAEGIAALDQAIAAPGTSIDAMLAAALVATPTTTSVASVTGFDPAKYSLVSFGGTADLYDALTRDGRCAPKVLAAPREPCALILYRPVEQEPGDRNINFRPVFRVDSRDTIWATHNGKLQKVKIEDLFTDIADTVMQKRANYRAVALVGNAENASNCAAGLPCLNGLSANNMFQMYASMPDNVVKTIWGRTN